MVYMKPGNHFYSTRCHDLATLDYFANDIESLSNQTVRQLGCTISEHTYHDSYTAAKQAPYIARYNKTK